MVQNKIITVLGYKGYGKTTLTEKLMIELNKPTIICDPRSQYQTDSKRRLLFRSVASFKRWLKSANNYQLFKKYKLEIVINVLPNNFEELAILVNKMKDITFCVDEVDMFFDTTANNTHELYKLVNFGRHNRIDLITTSRRFARINRDLTAMTDIFYLSRIREPLDKKYIKQSMGDKFVDTVENLERFEFLKWEDVEDYKTITTTKSDLDVLAL